MDTNIRIMYEITLNFKPKTLNSYGAKKREARETSQGWEAICISTGVGYVCHCGDVKPYY